MAFYLKKKQRLKHDFFKFFSDFISLNMLGLFQLEKLQALYEKFLLIDADNPAAILVRVRAIYIFGWSFILTQLLNIIGITYAYGEWRVEQNIAILGAVLLFLGIHCLRFYRNFLVYGLMATVLCAGAPLLTALYDYTGIDTALIPFLVMCPMLTGFISGPRLATFSGVVCIGVVGILYYNTTLNPSADPAYIVSVTSQRALQAGLGTLMVTIISATFSTNTFRAFRLMEEGMQQARQAEATKSEFLTAISHELRKPLQSMITLTEAIEYTTSPQERSRMIGLVAKAGEGILTDIEDILDISEIDTGKLQLIEAPFPPRELVRGVIQKWRHESGKKGLSFNSALERSLSSPLIGDEIRVRQILTNLIGNAIRYTKTGSIFVGAKVIVEENGQAVLQCNIDDTGPGIPDAIHQSLFADTEQRMITENDSQHNSPALGLPLSKHLTELMGGTMALTTSAAGTQITISLPLKSTNFQPAQLQSTVDTTA